MSSEKPFIIVGAGLAGLSVAIRLIEQNQPVIVYDNQVNHSSAVAAGMINPLVFRRMTKSWRVDAFMPMLISFYKELEMATENSFFHPITIRRVFSTEDERNLWLKKQNLPEFQNYMELTTTEDGNYNGAINKFGSGRVKQSAYIETIPFLSAAKTFVANHAEIRNISFDYQLISNKSYDGKPFNAVIFCEGYLNPENPFFNYLPLQQTKGETLTIKSDSLPKNESINRKCFVLPVGQNAFKIGSTYDWNNPSLEPTLEGRQTILENLTHLTEEKVEIIDQQAGIRPTTMDRRPLMGTHPQNNDLFIFNGLGAKGYMLAPMLSKEMVDYILKKAPLDAEVDIKRFEK